MNLLIYPEQEQVFKQIDILISEKYTFKHYNGGKSFNTYLEEQIKSGINDFDNKVVIVDEVHNVISMMMGGSKIGSKLQKLLMEAVNCRIVFLSGTPGINSPYELGVMLSILRGYIKSYRFSLKGKKSWDKEVDSENVRELLRMIPGVDQVIIDKSRANIEITRNPFLYSNLWDDQTYLGVRYENNDMSDDEFIDIVRNELKSSGYTMSKNSVMNFTTLPTNEKEFNEFFIDLENLEVKNKELFKKRILGLISYYKGIGDNVFPDVIKEDVGAGEGIVEVPMSTYQFKQYETVRQIEREKESKKISKKDKGKKDGAKDHLQALQKNTSYYRTFSRQRCNFVFPPEIERPMNVFIAQQMKNNKNNKEEVDNEDEVQIKYRLDEAINLLAADKDNLLSKESLTNFSPKFLKILENIESSPGLALVYSCFKTCEGLGVFALVLEANGYARYKVSIKDKEVVVDISPEDIDKPKYMIYSGNESEYERRILRDIFNSNENIRGDIIKVFLTSPSGAEGISLSNVRQVHIMEPFWHMVRLEQVMGRAVRICSHKNLPKMDRNVQIFVYLTVFTNQQARENATIMIQDQGKTSDQYIFNLATKKKIIMNSIFKLMKEASVDCSLNYLAHTNEYVDEGRIKCLHFGTKVTPENYSYIPDITKETLDKHKMKQQREEKIRAAIWEWPKSSGNLYMLGSDKLVYDYKAWNSIPPTVIQVGKIVGGTFLLYSGENIIDIQDTSGKLLYFDKENRSVYDKDSLLMKLTTTKSKGPHGSKKIEFYYNKKTNIVYSKLELISDNKLVEVGKVVDDGKKKKIAFNE